MNNNQGQALLLKNAICIHEEDYGLLWKHTEFVEKRAQCRRSRRLVVSCWPPLVIMNTVFSGTFIKME